MTDDKYDFEPPDCVDDVDCFEFTKHTIATHGLLGLCMQCRHGSRTIPTEGDPRCAQGYCERLSDLNDTLDAEIGDIVKEVYYGKEEKAKEG